MSMALSSDDCPAWTTSWSASMATRSATVRPRVRCCLCIVKAYGRGGIHDRRERSPYLYTAAIVGPGRSTWRHSGQRTTELEDPHDQDQRVLRR